MSLYLPKAVPYNDEEIAQHVVKRVAHWKLGYVGVEVSSNYLFLFSSTLNPQEP